MQLEATAMEEGGIIRVDDVAVRRIEVDSRSSGECMQAAKGPASDQFLPRLKLWHGTVRG